MCYAEVQSKAVHVPSKYFFDHHKGCITLQEFFGEIHFAAGGVVLVVGAKDSIHLVEEILLHHDALYLQALLQENEVVDVHVNVANAALCQQGWQCCKVLG